MSKANGILLHGVQVHQWALMLNLIRFERTCVTAVSTAGHDWIKAESNTLLDSCFAMNLVSFVRCVANANAPAVLESKENSINRIVSRAPQNVGILRIKPNKASNAADAGPLSSDPF
jgi:hypothetical protein